MFTAPAGSERRALFAAACAVAIATAVGVPEATGVLEAKAGRPAGASLAKIERYCVSSWRNAGIRPDDWEDCTQQALVELLEQFTAEDLQIALEERDSPVRRELNRAVWRQAKRSLRATRWVSYDDQRTHPVKAADCRESARCGSAAGDWQEVAEAAGSLLSSRQWTILDRSRQGWRTAEIARELGIPAARVSDEKYKAIAKLREHLGGEGEEVGLSKRPA